jgi:hypothetical protein
MAPIVPQPAVRERYRRGLNSSSTDPMSLRAPSNAMSTRTHPADSTDSMTSAAPPTGPLELVSDPGML